MFAWLLISAGCSNSAGSRVEWRAPNEYAARSTGCVDTPFIGPDHRSVTSGVQCGREASPDAMVVRGRVVGETIAGLPGPGLEALWVSVHAIDGSAQLSRLPPAQAETKTGPQGAFALPLTRTGDHLIVVRAESGGPVLAARRVQASLDASLPELLLLVASEQAALAPEAEPQP